MRRRFPLQAKHTYYLTEGGQETELMYRFGFELPEFAMFPLLDRPDAVAALTSMYTRYLETAATNGFSALLGGLDYRASPDWATKVGYSADGLAEAQFRCIDFLGEVARPFREQVPSIQISGLVGPRGDAYSHNQRCRRRCGYGCRRFDDWRGSQPEKVISAFQQFHSIREEPINL